MSNVFDILRENKIKPGDIFIDLGSHLGEEIEEIIKIGNVEIHSFEPHPIIFKELKNKFDNIPGVHLYNKAAWIYDGTITLFFKNNKEQLNGGASVIIEKTNISPYLNDVVECIDISKFLHNLGKEVSVFKMDIEGGEYEVLDSLEKNGNLKNIKSIYYEDHSRKIHDLSWNEKRTSVLERYKQIGYELKDW